MTQLACLQCYTAITDFFISHNIQCYIAMTNIFILH